MRIKTASEIFHPPPMAYAAHNAEVREVWRGFEVGAPRRMPMILGVNSRFIMLDPRYNPEGIEYVDCFHDPQLMLEVNLRFEWFMRHFLPHDREMGLPDHWESGVSFMNTYEAEWFGGALQGIHGDLPDVLPFIDDDGKAAFLKKPCPDPFAGIGARAMAFYEYFQKKVAEGYAYEGVPLMKVHTPLLGTDGPMTVACAIRGATAFCLDLYEDPGFARDLLTYITEATIERIRAWRKVGGVQTPAGLGFADDSIALISPEQYEAFVFPHHRRLVEALSLQEAANSIHLCGDATRHFAYLKEHLGVMTFDTGYPVAHGDLVRRLGPDVTIHGGPRVDLLLHGTPRQCSDETRRIMEEVMPYTRRFIMREANNLPPLVPQENIAAMYRAVHERPYPEG